MSTATKIGDELHALVRGEIPDTRLWQTEIYLGVGPRPQSQNKWWACNAAEARFAQLKHNDGRVREVLDGTLQAQRSSAFTEGEDLTPEEVYRGLMAFGSLTLSGVAGATGHPAAAELLEHASAHPGWMLLGAAPGPGLAVTDHQLDNVGRNVVLIGDGARISRLPFATGAGMRGWVRRRDKGSSPVFLFTDRRALSMILAQAAGLERSRRDAANEHDRFEAIRKSFPQMLPWGFTPAQQAIARAFIANPTDLHLLIEVIRWLRSHVPALPFKFTRFVDGSIFVQLLRSHHSSTDCVAGQGWFAPRGVTKTMSAGTGARDGGGSDDDVKPMRGWEDARAWYCQDEDGREAPQSIAKPVGVAVAYTVETREGEIFAFDGNGAPLGQTAPSRPPGPAAPIAPTHVNKPRKRRRFNFS
jgi:hypothetical protein